MGRISLRFVILVLVCLVFWGRSAPATTYYVATNGNDSNPGTEEQPWKTPAKAAAVKPGDVVRIRAGEYLVGPTWRVNRAGTADRPITYQAYGDSAVQLHNSTVVPAEGWQHLKGKIYSTEINEPVLAVFANAYPVHGPGERAKTTPWMT